MRIVSNKKRIVRNLRRKRKMSQRRSEKRSLKKQLKKGSLKCLLIEAATTIMGESKPWQKEQEKPAWNFSIKYFNEWPDLKVNKEKASRSLTSKLWRSVEL